MVVRVYREGDRAALRRIGEQIARSHPHPLLREDPELFTMLYLDDYLAREPESCHVAEVGGRIVGYTVVCTDTARQRAARRWRLRPRVARHVVAGVLRLRYRTVDARRALWWAVLDCCRPASRRRPTPPLDAYPAHTHTGVDAGARGLGVGYALSRAVHAHLRARGVRGLHGIVVDRAGSESAFVRYVRERRGYRLAASQRHPLLSRLTGEPWEIKLLLCDLSPPQALDKAAPRPL